MIDYKQSGVDVEEGYNAVNEYKAHAARTRIPGLLSDLGSFNGMFEIPSGLRNPVAVSGTDGVGTKLDIAFQMGRYDTVGIDCVAMSVNDILCSGVRTSFFLDYVACGKLDAKVAGSLVKGVADGCVDAGCALLGGETAEMPGFYDVGKYDLAGFGVGFGERDEMVTGRGIAAGDALVGLSSTGPHSNGYSLIRRLVPNLGDDFCGRKIGDVLLTPTRIYVRSVMDALGEFGRAVHGMVHITGGGFYENVPRMYPKGAGLVSVIRKGSWERPPIFDELIRRGADPDGVFGTFNMGIGFVMAVAPDRADEIVRRLNARAEEFHAEPYRNAGCSPMRAQIIGEVEKASGDLGGDLKGSREATRLV